MDNPLLEMEGLPPFCAILPEMVGPAIDRLLAACRARIEELTRRADPPAWESFVEPLEEVDDRLNLDEVRDQVAVMKPPAFSRFAHSFSHIFSGGYAAGYYSYKWAEVLSADAFSLFEERGVFDSDAGRAFRENILEQGGSADAMDLYVGFRGREPTIDALLRHSGIAS
jgi:Zn-dependent oligopeptidase